MYSEKVLLACLELASAKLLPLGAAVRFSMFKANKLALLVWLENNRSGKW